MAGDETPKEKADKEIADCVKRKATAQASFTRIYNNLAKLIQDKDVPIQALHQTLADLTEKFKLLETKVDELIMKLPDSDDMCQELSDLLSSKYDLLTDLRSTIMRIDEKYTADVAAKELSSNENTAELIRSFKASLTLPRPEIKKFNGNAADYSNFMSYVESYVEESLQDYRQRLTLLIDSCENIAHDSISFLSMCEDGKVAYTKAKQILHDLFGGKHTINRAVLDECTNGAFIKPTDFSAMRRLVISLKKTEVTLKENHSAEQLTSTDNLVKIFKRLPKHLQNKWNDRVLDLEDRNVKPSFSHMCHMIESYVKSRDNVYNVETSRFQSGKSSNREKPVYTVSESSNTCLLCQGSHYLNQCNQFIQMSLQSRLDFVHKHQLCRNCLHSGHIATRCKKKVLCKQCSFKHNNLLHSSGALSNGQGQNVQNSGHIQNVQNSGQSSNVQNSGQSSNVQNSGQSPNVQSSGQSQTVHGSGSGVSSDAPQGANSGSIYSVSQRSNECAGISCIEVLVEGKDALFKCKAIVDPKSSANLCTKRLAGKLNLPCVPFQTTLNVATGSQKVQGQRVVTANVYSKDMKDSVIVNSIMAIDSIPVSIDSLFTHNDISHLSHLKDVELPHCESSDEIDLLIGSGVTKAFHQFEQRTGPGDILAVRQTLGWELVGKKRNSGIHSHSNALVSASVFLTNQHSPVDILNRMHMSDFSDCSVFSDKLCPSVEDKVAEKLVKDSLSIQDNKFEVGIPWKRDPLSLPESKGIVSKRLNYLKQKLIKDSSMMKAYSEEMNKFIDKGYLERSNSKDTNLCHYIPHFPVYHPQKGSLRIVFDCALSLNDHIYEGPDILNSLVDVLIRFRRYRYVICSDIRKMYLNVNIPVKDRGAFRILWWPDGNLSTDPIELRATVHIYGAKSSGFVANYCVRQLADQTTNADVTDVINNDFYVDDQITSIQSEEKAVELVQEVSRVLDSGGFHLTKFVSNSSAVLGVVPDEDRVKSMDLVLGEAKYEHSMLGLKWEVQSDILAFPCLIPADDQIPSRRKLLSIIAKVYDPLGAVSPITLPIKILLQKKSSLGWDDIDDEMSEQFHDFCMSMEKISMFSMQRCYKPSSDNFNDVHISLHGFSDASSEGYSAVVYIRQVASDGSIAVSFVLGKSRVAPKFKGHIPQATIPKLELHAAALVTKLVLKVKSCLGFDIEETYYWCDSKAVLSCISSVTRRFPVYWSNRLGVIHANSDVFQWRYVQSEQNPADVGSRGVKACNFKQKMHMWINGPEFLSLPATQWPESTTVPQFEDIMIVSEEHKSEPGLLSYLISYYSKLGRLLNVVTRILRFMKHSGRVKPDITSDDMKQAELALVKFEQVSLVQSDLKKLHPFKDDQGILRVNSRLSQAEHLSFDARFPIILPKGSHLTKLIIQNEHNQCAHMGPNHVLSNLRRKYWVIGGKNTVNNALAYCRKCKETNAKPLVQQMSPLPGERIQPSFPFQFVGLDYFGPFMCKIRRQRFKRYGCIFVCLASRAIHLEVVNSLETTAFLSCLSRFIARRGVPEKIYSDNATNFKGAQDELKNIVVSVDKEASQFATSRGFQWHFHPPLGSHHAGHYERLIRSVRRVLTGITNEQEMSEDNLTTFLCESERILNDRPLSRVSEDPTDDSPLTPNQILLLRSNSSVSMFQDCSKFEPKKFHRQAMYLADLFWTRWLKDYVPSLQARQKWLTPQRNLKIDDIVLMCGEGFARGHWPIARILEVYPDSDGLVRKVLLKEKNGLKVRPISKLALLEASD